MDPQQLKLDSGVLVFDADTFSAAHVQPDENWFLPGYWESQGLVTGRQPGRGITLMIRTPLGPCVLRQYLRGGMVAKFIRSRYAFTGYENSRPLREFQVLVKLADLGLPAPEPIAGLCNRHGLSTTGAIMTREIEKVRPLEQVCKSMDESGWYAVGSTIRRFHDHGLVHADLTVRNILVQEGGKIFLVDFDRARFQANAGSVFQRSLKRLHRSMVKSQLEKEKGLDERAWMQLLNGYG